MVNELDAILAIEGDAFTMIFTFKLNVHFIITIIMIIKINTMIMIINTAITVMTTMTMAWTKKVTQTY